MKIIFNLNFLKEEFIPFILLLLTVIIIILITCYLVKKEVKKE